MSKPEAESWHLVTGEYPPLRGGVGDFSATVAHLLASDGGQVFVWTPNSTGKSDPGEPASPDGDGSGIRTRRADFDRAGLIRLGTQLDALAGPKRILIQYVPNAFGFRGMNLPFCDWVRRRQTAGDDVRVVFHEPFFYFGFTKPHRNVLAMVQRLMAWTLMRGARIVYLSTPTWERYLRPYSKPGTPRFVWLPLPATLPVVSDPAEVANRRLRRIEGVAAGILLGHFGTYGSDIAIPLETLIPRLLDARPAAHFLLLGRRSDLFCKEMRERVPRHAARLHATGDLSPEEASLDLQTCDVLLQPYPDGVTARRTSLINLLAHGSAVVTTEGLLTEHFWKESKACLLRDPRDETGLIDAVVEAASSQTSIKLWGGRAKAFHDKTFHPNRLRQSLALEAR